MEQNKLDNTQLIGFLFLIAAFIWLFMFQPEIEDLDSTVVPATEDFPQPERNNGNKIQTGLIRNLFVNKRIFILYLCFCG